MPSGANIKAAFLPAASGSHTVVTGSYAVLGDAFTQPVVMFHIASSLNQAILLSFDGTNDHILVPARTLATFDLSSNKRPETRLELPIGTQIYIKQGPDTGATSGDIYITLIYAS